MIKVIESGINDNFIYRSECLNCGTTFEYTSDELEVNSVGTLAVRCPECGNRCYHIGSSVSGTSTSGTSTSGTSTIKSILNKLKNRWLDITNE